MSIGNDLMITHIESCDYCILISDLVDELYDKLKVEIYEENKKLLKELIDYLHNKGENCFNNSMI